MRTEWRAHHSDCSSSVVAEVADACFDEGDGGDESGVDANAVSNRAKKEGTLLAVVGFGRNYVSRTHHAPTERAQMEMEQPVPDEAVSAGTAERGSCGAAAATAASAHDDGSDEELGHKIWRSSCVGRAAAARAARAATSAGATSVVDDGPERKRLAHRDQSVAYDRVDARASTRAATSTGDDESETRLAQETEVAVRNFRSLFTVSNNDPFAVLADNPHPAAEIAKVPCAVLKSEKSRKNNRLDPDRGALMDAIGFQVDGAELPGMSRGRGNWNDTCSKLEAYHTCNGHCNVPSSYQADHQLGYWVRTQRKALKNGTLTPDRVARLDRIGFQADRRTAQWDTQFRKLEAYQASNGHCNVPSRVDLELANWANIQRGTLRKGMLKPERAARLDGIGFQQKQTLTEQWNAQFKKLEAYLVSNGHCNVSYRVDPGLSKWVRDQRRYLRKGTLKPERATRLDAIGCFNSEHSIFPGE